MWISSNFKITYNRWCYFKLHLMLLWKWRLNFCTSRKLYSRQMVKLNKCKRINVLASQCDVTVVVQETRDMWYGITALLDSTSSTLNFTGKLGSLFWVPALPLGVAWQKIARENRENHSSPLFCPQSPLFISSWHPGLASCLAFFIQFEGIRIG